MLYEFVLREDLNRVLAPHRLKMAKVSGDESVGPASYGHFEEGTFVGIGEFEGQWLREDRLATPVDTLENRSNISGGKGELRSRENSSILGDDSIVVKRDRIALEQKAQHLGR